MLGTIRKFSSSIGAKIFLFIVAIPFVFWGMGPVFQSGNKNTIVEINNKKIPTQEFIDYMNLRVQQDVILEDKQINSLLSNFIGEKLINLEIEDFDIKLSDKSLGDSIKNEKNFIRNKKFSRIEYEKFLIKNNLNATIFEKNLSNQIKKKQLFDFIGGGIKPSNFLVNSSYDAVNQKREVSLIDLNDVFKKKQAYSEESIKNYYNKNKKKYSIVNKKIKFKNLSPANITSGDEFSNLFFKKLDEIDELVVNGKNIDFILKKLNLPEAVLATFTELDINKEKKVNSEFPNELIKKVFKIKDIEPTLFVEENNRYFIIELIETLNLQKNISDQSVKDDIIKNLHRSEKNTILSEIVNKINTGKFKKIDFENFSSEKGVPIKNAKIENLNDTSLFKQELINQIYKFPENRVVVIADIGLTESYIVYIKKIESSSIDSSSENYEKYLNFAKAKMTTNLYNTYDLYLKSKYEININYKTLDKINNYFK